VEGLLWWKTRCEGSTHIAVHDTTVMFVRLPWLNRLSKLPCHTLIGHHKYRSMDLPSSPRQDEMNQMTNVCSTPIVGPLFCHWSTDCLGVAFSHMCALGFSRKSPARRHLQAVNYLQKSMSGISVHPDSVNIVWELRVKKMVCSLMPASLLPIHTQPVARAQFQMTGIFAAQPPVASGTCLLERRLAECTSIWSSDL
jgi:hypothetical protein